MAIPDSRSSVEAVQMPITSAVLQAKTATVFASMARSSDFLGSLAFEGDCWRTFVCVSPPKGLFIAFDQWKYVEKNAFDPRKGIQIKSL
jgi:hypothetical protein